MNLGPDAARYSDKFDHAEQTGVSATKASRSVRLNVPPFNVQVYGQVGHVLPCFLSSHPNHAMQRTEPLIAGVLRTAPTAAPPCLLAVA
jgi:hypothetical protein